MARSHHARAALLATALFILGVPLAHAASDGHGHAKPESEPKARPQTKPPADAAGKPGNAAATPPKDAHAGEDHADEDHNEEKGPNGGALTRTPQGNIELLLVEAGSKPVVKVWADAGGKAIAARDLRVSAVLERPGSATQTIQFAVDGSGVLASREEIAEPHLFTLHAQVSWPGLAKPIEAELVREEGKLAITAEKLKIAGVTVEAAGSGELATGLSFPGEIRFNADRVAHVVPRASGVVQSVSADLGQQVKKGQALATVSSATLSDMRSDLRAAQRRRDLATTTLQREEKLWREQVSAEQDYLQARSAQAESQIAVDNAAQKLRAIGATPEGSDMSLLTLRAPFDGVVVEKHISLGESLADSASIFTIADLRTVWAEFTISAKDIGSVRVGESARVTAAGTEGSATGKIAYVGALLGQQNRAATARITLDNPQGAWRPGLFVNVDVIVDASRAPVTVLAEAVQTINNASVVFVEMPGGFAPQPVQLGRSGAGRVEILAGLAPGARYAARNAFVLKAEQGKGSAEHAH